MSKQNKSYLKAFKELEKFRKDLFTLTGDCLLVEVLKEDELQKTKSGIFLAEKKDQIIGVHADKPTFARVLLVGEGFYNDETKESIPLDTKQGDIVLVGNHSLKRFSSFGKLPVDGDIEIALMRDGDIQMRFLSEDSYDKTFEVLKKTILEKNDTI